MKYSNSWYTPFPEVKGNFGFGCMRLPLLGNGEVDNAEFSKMVDAFLGEGFNYFDTAHGYLDGKSEKAIRECIAKRHRRDEFLLTNKLSNGFFKKNEDIRPFFESQLEACGVDYFDFYLMHSQQRSIYSKYKQCRAYEEAFKLKEEGKVRYVGISIHDTADFLEEILNDYPNLDVVQIQLNYADYEDPSVQSRALLEVCRKHGKPVIVMEPVKGGHLVNLPAPAKAYLAKLGVSPANLAIRFAAGCEGVFMTLSGMGNMDMMRENVGFMKEFKPLDPKETEAVGTVNKMLKAEGLISCTACRYCVDGCPKNISIPDLIACANNHIIYKGDWNAEFYYEIHTEGGKGKASDCIKCGLCEEICPQHLKIRDILTGIASDFEKKS